MTKNLYLSFRALTSLIFITAGIGHALNLGKVLKRLEASTIYEWLPMPPLFLLAVMFSGIIMLAGGISLIINFRMR